MVKMGRNKIKIYLIIITAGLLAGGLAQAAILTPPKLPVLYYGTASINSKLATTSPAITMRRKTDNLEIASATAASAGKYFMEVPCADYVGQTMVFRIGNLITHEAGCVDVASVPSVNLDLNFSSANQTVENTVSNIIIPSSIADSQAAEIHFTATSTLAGKTITLGPDGLILKRESAVLANSFVATFASSTVITGDSSWDGTLIAPSLSSINLNIPADPDMYSQAEKIINIGFTGQVLTFDKPVSILFPLQTGRRVGFSRTGADFTEITVLCPENSLNSLPAATTQECKFNGPVDLTVWTKHFTYFAVYTQVYVPPPSRGGGGFISEIKQAAVATSTIATTSEANLIATSTPTVEPIHMPQVQPQVLGVKYYANGTLIRGQDKKIYLIKNNKLVVIRTVAQLKEYKGQKIYDVPDPVIRQYLDFFDGQLIRDPDKKIYVITQGLKKPIKNLQELKQFGARKIHDVSLEILNKFSQYTPNPAVEYFANSSLIRGQDGKIYLIQNNKLVVIRTLAQLNKYQGQKIYDVPDPVIRQYLDFFDGQLIRGSMGKIYIITNHKKQPIFTLRELNKYKGQKIYDVSDKILGLY